MGEERYRREFIIRTAERILARAWAGPVRLHPGDRLSDGRKSITLRCAVAEAPGGAPPTVIVKKVREEWGGYHPDSPDIRNDAHALFSEWASLQLLGSLPVDPPLAPRLFRGDRAAGVIALEDLGPGDGPSLDEILHGTDPSLAEERLIEYASALGRLHASTIGRLDAYRSFRDALGPRPERLPLYKEPWSDARLRPSPADEIDQAVLHYRHGFASVGIQPAPGVDTEIAEVTRRVEEDPGPFLALCQGDQNGVGGLKRCGDALRFYDFDCGGFRHALLEGMPARITWGGMTRVPAPLVRRMDGAYQAALSIGCPAAADDDAYHRAMADAGGRWHIFHVIWRLPDGLEHDRPRGPTTLRQQLLAWTDAFADLSEETAHLPSLGRSARMIAARLRTLWPPEVHGIPYYPAFEHAGG